MTWFILSYCSNSRKYRNNGRRRWYWDSWLALDSVLWMWEASRTLVFIAAMSFVRGPATRPAARGPRGAEAPSPGLTSRTQGAAPWVPAGRRGQASPSPLGGISLFFLFFCFLVRLFFKSSHRRREASPFPPSASAGPALVHVTLEELRRDRTTGSQKDVWNGTTWNSGIQRNFAHHLDKVPWITAEEKKSQKSLKGKYLLENTGQLGVTRSFRHRRPATVTMYLRIKIGN